METIIAEETSTRELQIKRASLGAASALLVAGGIVDGAAAVTHLVDHLSLIPSYAPSLKELVNQAKEAVDTVFGLGASALMGWAGLEAGDLALRSHRRLQELDEADNL